MKVDGQDSKTLKSTKHSGNKVLATIEKSPKALCVIGAKNTRGVDVRVEILVILLVGMIFMAGCASQGGTSPPPASPAAPQAQQPPQPNVQAPKCPASCEDGNPCTTKACNVSTNYSCVYSMLSNTSCGANKVCEEGVCKEKQAENNSLSPNITQNETTLTPAKSKTVVHLDNESNQFMQLVNDKRTKISAKVILNWSSKLQFIAKTCNEEMLKHNSANITYCYDKYGSFKEMLWDFGFFGNKFIFASESSNRSPALTQSLYDNMTSYERGLLTNQSVDDGIKPYPIGYDSIGTSIDCNDDRCIQTTVTAGNKEIDRNDFQGVGITYAYPLVKFYGDTFVPVKFTVRKALKSGTNIPQCKIYHYLNMSLLNADSAFFWSDSWGGYFKHVYQKEITWTDFYSETINEPDTLYVFCWSEQTRGTFEVIKEYLPNSKEMTEIEMQTVVEKLAEKKKQENGSKIIDVVNSIRAKKGYSALKESQDLNTLAESFVEISVNTKDYEGKESFNSTFVNNAKNTKYKVADAMATKNIFGNSERPVYNYVLLEDVAENANQIDTVTTLPSYLFDDEYARDLEYFGSGIYCKEDVCMSMFLSGSNTERYNVTNTYQHWLYGNNLLRLSRSDMFPRDMYPSLTYEFNSSVKATYYVYKEKLDADEVWGQRDLDPNIGWISKSLEKTNYYVQNLSAGYSYFLVYQPYIDKPDGVGNFMFKVRYIPKVPVK